MLRTFLQDEEIIWMGKPDHEYTVYTDTSDKVKSFFLYFVSLGFFVLLGGAALFITISVFSDFAEMPPHEKGPAIFLMCLLWIFALSVTIGPLLYFIKKKYVIKQHYKALKYTLTDKAAYISVDREEQNLIRLPYVDMKKIFCNTEKKDKRRGNIIFQMKYPIIKKKKSWWAFDFENTTNPEFSQLSDVQNVFSIIQSLTIYDVKGPNYRDHGLRLE